MELTNEILVKNGFDDNHPERVLNKFYLKGENPEWRIHVERTYIPNSNILGYMAGAWRCGTGDLDKGVIIKRSSASVIQTVEELQSVIDLCGIDFTIKTE